MYQWRKFEFFEEKSAGKCSIPDDVTGKIECCSTGRGKIVLGCDNGTVNFLDCGLKFVYGFQAYASSVLFVQQLTVEFPFRNQRNFIITIGEDEQISPQLSATSLKVFDLDKMLPEGSSSTTPDCLPTQLLALHVTGLDSSFLVLEEAPPILLISIGLDNGCVYCIKGDIARERITCFKLQVENVSEKGHSPITGLGFRVDDQALQLFAVTPTSVSLFSLQDQPPRRQTLDQIGCDVNNVTMRDHSELKIGRPEAVYFYEVDGRGPCWAFDGEKKFLGRGYLLCVIADPRNAKNIFNVYDLKNRLIAHILVVREVSHMLCEWGNIILIMSDKSALCIGEKDMESKLDMLFKKNLYTVDQSGYHEHAMYVAKKAGKHEWYLKILLEDLDRYQEALEYIFSLEPSQAGVTMKEYGKILVEHMPGETIEILLRLCAEEGESSKRGTSIGTYLSMLPSPVDFLNIFIHHQPSLMDFLEKYTMKVKDSPAQVEIHNTLLELYLSNDLNFSSISQVNAGGDPNLRSRSPTGVATMSRAESKEKLITNGKDSKKEYDRLERLEKGLRLLQSVWPSDLEHPLYDFDLAIILCEMNAFKKGLLFLYEKMKLYKEVIACFMQTLSKNPCLTLSVVKDYIARKLDQESKLIEEDRRSIEKYQEDTLATREEIQDLRTNARIFRLSKCTACTFTLDLPAVHFMCMHSFHQRCLGDNEKECPECAPEYRSVLEMKRSLEQNSKGQNWFFQQVKSLKDGFSVIAKCFGKGVISKTSNGTTGTLRSGSTSFSSGF
ncbi:hypothetical protein HHK36_028278 [Tetracentron sinense]|uniref:RING-type domain-containing protein n=1 Tax=Tetracentron sinense TaxID=13715 RepID=A0A834YJ46_TETSI|nr:hypothetical protein HHK36_028278 [Tetracentron sinense]